MDGREQEEGGFFANRQSPIEALLYLYEHSPLLISPGQGYVSSNKSLAVGKMNLVSGLPQSSLIRVKAVSRDKCLVGFCGSLFVCFEERDQKKANRKRVR